MTGVRIERGRVAGVETSDGDIATDILVNCAGMWARELGRLSGVTVPLHACEHMYIVTNPIEGVTPDLPVMRDADGHIYFKEEVAGLLMGGFDPWAKPWGMDGIPKGFSFGTLPEDWDEVRVAHAPCHRARPRPRDRPGAPAHERAGELHSRQLLHPRRGAGGAALLRGRRVLLGRHRRRGGAGRALAEWIVEDRAPMDLWQADIRRFAPFHANAEFLRERVSEIVGVHYFVAFPNREPESGRGLRRSPLYERLRERRACFGSKMGWERANWFAPPGSSRRRSIPSAGRTGFPTWRRSIAPAARPSLSSTRARSPSSAWKVPTRKRSSRSCAPMTWRWRRGAWSTPPCSTSARGFESDLTVTRLGPEAYLIVTGSAQATRDFHWITSHLDGARATLTDVTGAYAVLGLMGPRSRDLLARLTPADLSSAALPVRGEPRDPAGARLVRASRITYVGELGWELYVPVEFAAGVYDAPRGGGRRSRASGRRVLRHRVAPRREGLSRMGTRAHHGLLALRGGPRLRRLLRQGGALHRPRGAPRPARTPGAPAPRQLCPGRSRGAASRR